MKKIYTFIEEIMNIIRKRLPIIFLIILLFFTMICYTKSNLDFPKKIITICIILGVVLTLKFNRKIELNIFLLILGIGSISCFITPVLDAPDEPAHFLRAMYVSEGNFGLSNNVEELQVSKNAKSILNQTQKTLYTQDLKNIESKTGKSTEPYLTITNAYSFIPYLPSALGIKVSKVFNTSLFWMFYLGRFFNLLFYSLIAYLSVLLAKKWKLIIGVLASMPMAVYLAASYNQDGFANALTLLIICLFLNMIESKDKIGHKELIIYTLLCTIMATTKLPYVLLAALVVFIPIDRFNNKKMYLYTYLYGLFVAFMSAIWFMYYSSINPVHRPEYVDVSGQLSFIREHIAQFFLISIRGLGMDIERFHQLFNFGWLSYEFSAFTILYAFFIGVVIFMLPMKRLPKLSRIGVGIVSLGMTLLINLSMYMTWTHVGLIDIEGVQGRYFFSVLLLSPFVINFSHYFYRYEESECIELTDETLQYKQVMLLMFICLFFNLAMLASTIGKYY